MSQEGEWNFRGQHERISWFIRRVRRHGVPPGPVTLGPWGSSVVTFVGLAAFLLVAAILW